MNAQQTALALKCLQGAEHDTMSFPEIVGALTNGGFESYLIDYRRATATYYLPSGESLELAAHGSELVVSERFDPPALKAAIHEAQTLAPGYTYKRFCEQAKAAGCAGYMISFLGGRALYFSRAADTHVELFPSQ